MENNEYSFIDVLEYLIKNIKLIIIVNVVILGLSFTYAILKKPVYKAVLSFVSEEPNIIDFSNVADYVKSMPGVGNKLKGLGVDYLEAGFESREVSIRLQRDDEVYSYYLDENNLKDLEVERYSVANVEAFKRWLHNSSSLTEDEELGLNKLNIVLSKKEWCPVVANRYFEVLNQFIIEKTVAKAKRRKEYLESQLNAITSRRLEIEGELKDISKKYNIVSFEKEAGVVIERVLDLKKNILAWENELKSLKEFAGEKNIEVKKLTKQIEIAKKQIEDFQKGKNVGVSTVPMEELLDIKYSIEKLQSELDALNNVYINLKEDYEVSKVSEIDQSKALTVIDSPLVPQAPFKPNKKMIMLMGFVFGVMFSIVLALLKDLAKYTRKELKKRLKKEL